MDKTAEQELLRVKVNGEERELPAETGRTISVRDALIRLGYRAGDGSRSFAVALNLSFIPRGRYETTLIRDGDSLEIVAPMQGG